MKTGVRRLGIEVLEERRLLSVGPPAPAASATDPGAGNIIYEEHFDNDSGGYTADNTGGTLQGLWHFSTGRSGDGLDNHSPDYSWYYGVFETPSGGGHYILPRDHQGSLISPVLPTIPECGTTTLSFNYFLDTRPELGVDFVEVYVVEMVGGVEAGETKILSRADGTLPETGNNWLPATYELTPFAGDTIKLRFFFDTGDVPLVDPEGWYVDDVMIVNLCQAADLSVTKEVDDSTPDEGQLITYTITAVNAEQSNAAATGVTVVDNLPDGVTLDPDDVPEGYDPQTDTWTIGTLAPGESRVLVLPVTVNAGTAGQTLPNTAVIAGNETDPDDSNNQDSVTTIVNAVNLSVSKEVDDATPDEGQLITYTITAVNAEQSNAAATGVTVIDNLPDGVTLDPDDVPEGYDPQTDTWTIGTLAPGESRVLVLPVTVNAGTAGQTLPNTAVIAGNETDPDDSNNQDSVEIMPGLVTVTETIQFITPLSIFRPDGGEEPTPLGDGVTPQIAGYRWHDLNQNGQWDFIDLNGNGQQDPGELEPGLPGWVIEAYSDVNGSGILDQPDLDADIAGQAITDADGRYEFIGLDPGTYLIRAAVPFGIEAYPGGSGAHLVELAAGETVEGELGQTEPPNIGSFQYSPFKRPADTPPDDPDHPYLGNWTTHTDETVLLATLAPWQMITVSNQTAAAFNITGVTTVAAGLGADFVAVTDENLQPLTFPIVVPAGEEVKLWAFYSPEEPDWSAAPYRPAHTFARGDHLSIATDSGGGRVFDVALVGGSTYDGDVTYNGVVDIEDFGVLDDILAVDWPTVPGEPGWDPTADINVKFRNGVDSTPPPPNGTEKWPEIGLGDLGPLNAEFFAVRAPFVDLDWDNSSGVRGVDYEATYQVGSDPIGVVDSDARFANSPFLLLGSVTVTIANVEAGDVLAADTTGTNVSAGYDAQTGVLTLEANPALPIPQATVAEFETVLQTVTYSNQADASSLTPRVIEVQAIGIGIDASQVGEQVAGNVAVTTVTLEASAAAAGLSTAPMSAPGDSSAPELLYVGLFAAPVAASQTESAAILDAAAISAEPEPPAAAVTTQAAATAAVDAVMLSSAPSADLSVAPPSGGTEQAEAETASAAADQPLPDDLLRNLALYWLDSGDEEEEPVGINAPDSDPGALFS